MLKNNIHNTKISEEAIKKILLKKLVNTNTGDNINDDFINDAVEGFKQNPGLLKELPDLNKRAKNKFQFKSFPYRRNNLILISFAIITLTLIFAFFLIYNYKQKNFELLTPADRQVSDNMNKRSAGNLLPTNEKTSSIQDNTSETYTATIFYDNENLHALQVESYSSQKLILPDINNFLESNFKSYNYSDIIFPTIYLLNYKVVDYDKLRTSKSNEHNILNHLEAEYENAEDKNNMINEAQNRYIPYKLFLKGAIKKIINKNYSKALSDFSRILKQFPDDVNAQFYSGLCFYYLHNYNNAIAMFQKSASNTINTFNQESLWYMALSYESNNQKDKALEIYKKIYNYGGFYAGKAKEKLNSK
ncbi:MAG: hypothetical protein Kow0068_07000 [Marinilabiliales bacterium]